MNYKYLILVYLLSSACTSETITKKNVDLYSNAKLDKTAIIILGNVQDAGSPQIGCTKECCKSLFKEPDENRKVVSLGIVDPINNSSYLIDASPDITSQLKILNSYKTDQTIEIPTSIFLTHAHIGHYTGLMYFGKEAMNTNDLNVFVMPRMKIFLESNGPWSQLVTNNNIILNELIQNQRINLSSTLKMTPFNVPHRDEYSETVGFLIEGPNKKALFIPDIDKWDKWDKSIIDEISKVDYAFIDATFYDAVEINNRDISTIPHPFIIESMQLFEKLSNVEKNKINFIHFNHTNPVLNPTSKQTNIIKNSGFNIARINDVFEL